MPRCAIIVGISFEASKEVLPMVKSASWMPSCAIIVGISFETPKEVFPFVLKTWPLENMNILVLLAHMQGSITH